MKEKELSKNRKLDMQGFWKRLWFLISPIHSQIKKLLILIIMVETLSLVGPYILKLIIDLITGFKMENLNELIGLVVLMFFANQATSLASYFQDKKVFNIVVAARVFLSSNAHKKMVFLSLSYHEKENTGNKIIKIQRGVEKIAELISNFFWEVGPTILQVIFTAVVLFFIDWRFGLVILFFVPIFILQTLKINREVFPARLERHDNEELASGAMAQSIININTVKSFVQENREAGQFRKIMDKIRKNVYDEFRKIIRCNLKRNLVIDLGRIMIMLFGVFLVWQGNITLGSLVFAYTISEKALISLYRISRLYDRIMDSTEAVDRLYYLELEKSDIENAPNGIKPKNIEGLIEFKNVSFSYNESRIKALDKVSFKIQSGCLTALVGPSGGGKTTIARMIYRHYDPQKGAVLLDGKNIKDYDLFAIRNFFAIVPQEVEIFNASIRENIAYSKPGASFKEIQAAAKIANAEEFIDQLNEKYNTLVGERGIKLSGGQRQRIGIARAILANPRILIFDEATSNLDSYSERLIQEAMDRISKGRSVIIIAHRLSTIKKANKIVVLEKGKVVEEGSHFELAKIDGGLYRKLIELQRMGDVD